MSVPQNQSRTFLRLAAELRPHWRRDANLPARIQALLARHRDFGSRDRRLYRELIYTAIRYLPWIEPWLDSAPDDAVRRIAWLAADTPATRPFRTAFALGSPPAGELADLLPAWFRTHCPEIFSGEELATQLRRAPLWLRLQSAEPNLAFVEFAALGWRWRASPVLRNAVEMLDEVDVTKTEAWRNGLIEVQDVGSQLVLESIGIRAGEQWLDACAGAGGKTLQLACLLGPRGNIAAHDVRLDALTELETRARRAGIATTRVNPAHAPPRLDGAAAPIHIAPELSLAASAYDGVLVDAPCSGSGTWRRAPHLKWLTTEATITRAAEIQRTLLAEFAVRVRPGGRLVYATCSLSPRENEEVVNSFLAAHGQFQPEPFARPFGAIARGPGLLILPALHNTDGFFVASLRRRAAS